MHVIKHGERGNGNVHVAVDLACAQADLGHAVAFVSGAGSYDGLLREHGVEVLRLPVPTSVGGAAKCVRALFAQVRRFRPNVMHAHMMSSAVLGFLIGKLTRVPLVTTMHNSFDPHSGLMRLGAVVVAVSDAERKLLLGRGYSPKKVVTVLNGVVGSPREKLVDGQTYELRRPCVATLCGLHPRKGVADVISAFAEVAEDFPAWSLNIIGSGPDRARLMEFVEVRGMSGRVHFVGSTLAPRPLLRQADVFASGALSEPFSLATAEARAVGCAIVATEVGGVPEVVEHGRAGQLTRVSDPMDMAAAFRRLMGDPDCLQEWRKRSRDGAEFFSVDRMTRDYDDVYEALLGRRKSSSSVHERSDGYEKRTSKELLGD
ncbi:MAG: glycosyltransferase family 4 protein [Pseudonocardia sp.]